MPKDNRKDNAEGRADIVEEAFKKAGLNTAVIGGNNYLADRVSIFDLRGDQPNAVAVLLVAAELGTVLECESNKLTVKLREDE